MNETKQVKRIPGLEASGVRVQGIPAERLRPTLRIGAGAASVTGELTVDGSCVIVQLPPGKEGVENWQDVLIPLSQFCGIARLK